MKIKICGMRNKDNLNEVLKFRPDFMGFIFYPVSPRFVGNELEPGELAIVPRSVKKVGVFVNQDEYEIAGIRWKYGLDYIQLHGNETAEMCRNLKKSGTKIIKAFRVEKNFDFQKLMPFVPFCDFFLFDTPTSKYGGSGKKFDWELLKNYETGHPFLLSGGIKPDDAEEIMGLNIPSLAGVDINSGFETAPGMKDIAKLELFWHKMNRKKIIE